MKKGFTLIEILISFALSAVVFVVVSAILTTLFSTNLKSQRQQRFEQIKNDLFVELSNSIRWAKVVIPDEANHTLQVDGKTYSYADGKIYKNGVAMTTNSVNITHFDIKEFFTVPEKSALLVSDPQYGHSQYPGVQIYLELHDRGDGLTSDSLTLFAAQRKTEITQ